MHKSLQDPYLRDQDKTKTKTKTGLQNSDTKRLTDSPSFMVLSNFSLLLFNIFNINICSY